MFPVDFAPSKRLNFALAYHLQLGPCHCLSAASPAQMNLHGPPLTPSLVLDMTELQFVPCDAASMMNIKQ